MELTASARTTDPPSYYRAAEQLPPHRWNELVTSGSVRPNWIFGGDQFWYVNKSRAAAEYVLVDPVTGSRDLAFEPEHAAGSFDPQIVREGQTRLEGLNGRIIALYARGMTSRDIRARTCARCKASRRRPT
jgi:hypothetical protein